MTSKESKLSPSEAVIIVRPEDPALLERLTVKSQEYKQRFTSRNEYAHPAKILAEAAAANNSSPVDAYLKFNLLDEVLESGSADAWEFQERMAANPDLTLTISLRPEMYTDRMNNACAVIHSYCTQELSRLSGGTGI